MKIRVLPFKWVEARLSPCFLWHFRSVRGREGKIFCFTPSIPFILPASCCPPLKGAVSWTMHTQHCPPEISHRVTARLPQPQMCRNNVSSASADNVSSTEHKLGRQVIKVFTWWMKRGGEGSIISNRTSIFPLSHATCRYSSSKWMRPAFRCVQPCMRETTSIALPFIKLPKMKWIWKQYPRWIRR